MWCPSPHAVDATILECPRAEAFLNVIVVTWVPNVLRTRHAVIRPMAGIKPASGPLVIIHLCIRALTHRLRSYQIFSSAEISSLAIEIYCFVKS
jgi:hypothetical protein